MKTEKIHIENLKCNGCANTIRREIERFEEVEKVEVSHEDSSVTVAFEAGDDFREKITKRLAKLGYPEQGHNSRINQAKSYVSCAIGRITPE
jgi:copper chaperone CopZ